MINKPFVRRSIPWLYLAAWLLWMWWRWNTAPPVSVDIPETIHLGQWVLSHNRFPNHLHWVWGVPQGKWLAVGWEAGSAVVFAVAYQVGFWGLFVLWAASQLLAIKLTQLAIRWAGYAPSLGALAGMALLLSVFQPLVAAMWVIPGVAFLMYDAAIITTGRSRFKHHLAYGAVLSAWAWLSPSVIIAPILTVVLILFWPSKIQSRPWAVLVLRAAIWPVAAVMTIPHPLSWMSAVLRYVSGRVTPKTPWPSVTTLLHPNLSWTALPNLIWFSLLVLALLQGARLRKPHLLWWAILIPLSLLNWKEAYYTPLSLWALTALIAFMGPIKFQSRALSLFLPLVPIVFLVLIAIKDINTPVRMTASRIFPRYTWYRQMSARFPSGRIWVPLTEGGIFTMATGRSTWLDNRMQIWDAYPTFYARSAALATGRAPLGPWLDQHHVVAVLWPERPLQARQLTLAGWIAVAHGPGSYQLWVPRTEHPHR